MNTKKLWLTTTAICCFAAYIPTAHAAIEVGTWADFKNAITSGTETDIILTGDIVVDSADSLTLNRDINISGKDGNKFAISAADGVIFSDSFLETYRRGNKLTLKNVKMNGFRVPVYGTVENIISSVFEGNTGLFQGGALALAGTGETNISDTEFINNVAPSNGGGIVHWAGNGLNIDNSKFIGNIANADASSRDTGGGAISSSGSIGKISNSTFKNNKVLSSAIMSGGGAIASSGHIDEITGSVFEENEAVWGAGAIGATESIDKITNSIFSRNKAGFAGGAIFTGNTIGILSGNFYDNHAGQYGGALVVAGTSLGMSGDVTIAAARGHEAEGILPEVVFKGNYVLSDPSDENSDKLYEAIYNDGKITFMTAGNGMITTYDYFANTSGGVMTFDGDGTGTFNLFNDIKGTGNLIVASDYVFNMINDTINVIQGDTLTLNSTVKMAVDVDLANAEMDHIDIGAAAGTGSIIVDNMKIFSDSATEKTDVDFINNSADKVSTTVTSANSLKYSYDVSYDAATGQFTFVRNSDRTGSQIAGDLGQNMVTPGIQLLNNSLSTQVLNRDMGADENQGLSSGDPARATTWAKAFGSKDSVELKHSYNSIDTQFYGVVGGVDSRTFIYDNGINAVYGIYAAYMGSNQKQNSVKVTQDGGYLGVSADLTRNGVFSRFTAHGGYIANEAKTAWGNDKFDIWTASVSNKTAYEIDFGKYTLKPALYASYMYINTENYTSKAGAKLKNHTKNVFEVTPEVKLAKDFGTGLEGYAKVAYTWNFYQGGKVTADDVLLPKMSVKPYVEYGVGLEKDWSEEEWNPKDITSYAEINRHDGGRTGWDINAGLKFQF